MSSSTSTVLANPTSAPADGITPVIVTVTLLDANGNPVSGKIVNVATSRGSADTILQPLAPTNALGQATGTITSQQTGTATITASDASDGLTLQQTVPITFTASGPLVAKLGLAQSSTDGEFHQLSDTAASLAHDGDALRAAQVADAANAAVTTLLDTLSIAGTVPALKTAADLENYTLPGVLKQGWSHIVQVFDPRFDPEANIFNQALQDAVQSGDWKALAPRVVGEGVLAYGGDAASNYAQDKALDKLKDVLVADRSALSDSVLPSTQQELTSFQSDVDATIQQTIATLPTLTPQQQAAWSQDLVARLNADTVLQYFQKVLALNVDALWNDHEIGPSNELLEEILRSAGQALSYGLAPLGPILYASALAGFDSAINGYKLGEAVAGATLAVSGLNSVPNTGIAIQQNIDNGVLALQEGQDPETPSASVSDVGDVSNLSCWPWHLICNESSSSSTLQITNTGSAATTFIATAEYDTYGGMLNVLPLGAMISGAATIQPGQTATITLHYKTGNDGASPKVGSIVTFYLIGGNDTGQFQIGQPLQITWHPQQITSSAPGMPPALARVAAASAPVPDLVSSFVVPDPTTGGYAEQIWINNPLTEPITATISQVIPTGLTADQIGNGGSLQSGAVTWTLPVTPTTSTAVTLHLQPTGASAAGIVLPAATAHLVDTEGSDSGPLTTDAVTLAPLPALQLSSGIDAQLAPGIAATVPYSITNVSPVTASATLALSLTDTLGQVVFSTQSAVLMGPNATAVAPIDLPATLPSGLLQEQASVSAPGVATATTSDLVLVGYPSPAIDLSGPTGPISPDTSLSYTLALTNTTGQPLGTVVLTGTVSGPATVAAGAVTGGGVVQGNTVTWTLPGSLAPGAAVREVLPVQVGAGSSEGESVHVRMAESTIDTLPESLDAWAVLPAIQSATVPLAAGWNLIDLPLAPTGPISASTILAGVLQQSRGSLAAIYALQNGQWSAPLIQQGSGALVGTDFALQPGQGYLLYSDKGGGYLQTGAMPATQPAWALGAGWNLVGIALGASGPISATAVLAGVLQQSQGNLAAIYALQDGQWSAPLIQQGTGAPIGRDFALLPGQGYLLYTDKGASYTPAGSTISAQHHAQEGSGSTPVPWRKQPSLP